MRFGDYPVYDAIRKLLLEEWAPLGPGVPDDEYDQYAMGVWSRVERRETAEEIAAYLHWAAAENMEMTGGDPAKIRTLELKLATKALALKE